LRSATTVSRPTVKLSDVFEGLPDGIDCDIARAPAPGRSITYDVNVLARLAKAYKLDWQPQSTADHTTITTISTKLTTDDIRAAVIEKIKSYDVKGDVEVTFDNRALEVNLPADRAPNFMLNNFDYEPVNRRFRAELIADGFAGPISMPVNGRVTIMRSVPVLSRRLEAGTEVSAADIDWLGVPDDRLAGVATDAEQLIGHQLHGDAEAGQPIHARDVLPLHLVTRGALVTMQIETPMMLVTAQGRALQDGKLGDTVRVSNTQSNRTIEGTVIAQGLVRIPVSQKIAAANDEPAGKQE
jgi:flagella basal body P-ring formation protein FlgA